jgi:hypothetical protein
MSGVPKAPAAPRLRAIREAWLRPVIGQLEADPGISAAGFVGSIGRGDADDWSDVDLVIVVPDDQSAVTPMRPGGPDLSGSRSASTPVAMLSARWPGSDVPG